MTNKSQKIIGQTRDSVLATFVTKNKIRDFDKNVEDRKRDDVNHIGIEIREDEEIKIDKFPQPIQKDSNFYYCCVDELETVYIFSEKTAQNNKKSLGGY